LAGHIIRFLISYVVYPYRPRIKVEKEKFNELFMFGRWIFASSIVIFLVTQGDSIFVGKVMGITALGFYQMAFTLSNIPTAEISHVVSQVTFPTYSKLQDDAEKLQRVFFKVLQINAFIITPITIGIIFLAPEVISLLLGEKWLPMLGAMQVLAVAGFVRSIAISSGSLLLAINKPDLTTKLQVLRLIILGISIYPLTIKWGILGTSYAILLSITVATACFIYEVLSIIDDNFRRFVKTLIYPLGGATIMTTFFWIFKINTGIINISQFLLLVSFGALIYLFAMYLFDRYLHYGIYKLIRDNFALL
jgi:O-antigen/teichoic acid export membrane protein